MALAGTRRDRDREALGSLKSDPKEMREHGLVIDGISESLEGLGLLLQFPTEELPLPGLSHLKTRLELRAEQDLSFDELVRRLHPTPALGAYPREAGKAWLSRLDQKSPIRRRRFGAPFGARYGELHASELGGTGKCVVAIRGLQWRDNELCLPVGCGVIAESQLEREWQELQGKIRAVKGILGFL